MDNDNGMYISEILDEKGLNGFNTKKWHCLKKWANHGVNIVQYTHTPWQASLWLGDRATVFGPISVPKGRKIKWYPINMHNDRPIKIKCLEKNRKVPTENLVVVCFERQHLSSSYEPLGSFIIGQKHFVIRSWILTDGKVATTTQNRWNCIQSAAHGCIQPRITIVKFT